MSKLCKSRSLTDLIHAGLLMKILANNTLKNYCFSYSWLWKNHGFSECARLKKSWFQWFYILKEILVSGSQNVWLFFLKSFQHEEKRKDVYTKTNSDNADITVIISLSHLFFHITPGQQGPAWCMLCLLLRSDVPRPRTPTRWSASELLILRWGCCRILSVWQGRLHTQRPLPSDVSTQQQRQWIWVEQHHSTVCRWVRKSPELEIFPALTSDWSCVSWSSMLT